MAKRRDSAIIEKYRDALSLLGVRTERVILYGSYAVERAKDESDIDLAIVSPGQKYSGRVENWRSVKDLSPAPPHQTVRSVFPNTVFQSSSSRGFRRLSPWGICRYLI
jgi:predicted nucleotidyltransferase